jgi:hypothetical protein
MPREYRAMNPRTACVVRTHHLYHVFAVCVSLTEMEICVMVASEGQGPTDTIVTSETDSEETNADRK